MTADRPTFPTLDDILDAFNSYRRTIIVPPGTADILRGMVGPLVTVYESVYLPPDTAIVADTTILPTFDEWKWEARDDR